MPVRIEPFGSGDSRIVHRDGAEDLLTLPTDLVEGLFRQSGALLFRGFDVDPLRMKSFANRFSLRFNRDRLRPPLEGTDGFVQGVNEGMGDAQPHCEQANSPFRPDAIWFNCTRPAAEGGETLFWDGVRLWNELPVDLRELFAGRSLRFFQRYTRDRWTLFLGPQATVEDVKRTLEGLEGTSYFLNDDDSLYLEYVCPAVVKTRYGGHDAFANSLLSERKNTLGALMTFSDGRSIPDDAVHGIETTMKGHTQAIAWQAGDLVMLDNSRYLHGRNAFTDPGRRIFSCLSFLNF